MKEIEIFCPTFSPEAFKVAAKHLRVWYFDLNFWISLKINPVCMKWMVNVNGCDPYKQYIHIVN